MPVQILVLAALVGVSIALAVYLTVAPNRLSEQAQRVRAIDEYVSGAHVATKRATVTPSSVTASLVGLGEKVMKDRVSTSHVMTLMQRADLPLRSGEWGVVRMVSLIVGPIVGLLLLHGDLVPTLMGLAGGVALGALGPSAVLRFLAKRRHNRFERQMPDILMLVASSLSTGFSLMQALDACATDAPEPASKEFSRVMAETRIGIDVEDALERMAERMDSDNMRWTSMAIRIQRSVGGNLAETLRQTAATLRERESLQRQVKALSAEGKLSAYVLLALPIGLFLYEAQVNRTYIELLWTTTMGWGMLVAAAISLAIGMAWMKQVVKVQV